jgi:TM2 domain-containing membrane protein YozV
MDKLCTDRWRLYRGGDMTQAGWAAVLSLIIPGVGQIYNGDFLRGIFWLIVTPGFWIGTGGMLGWICHLIASYTAYSRGGKYMRGEIAK